MMIHEVATGIWTFLAGWLTGVLFFGGLWLTLKNGLHAAYAALIFFVSFILRTAVAITVFYCVMKLGWPYLVASLAGFMIARFMLALLFPGLRRQPAHAKRTGGEA